MVAAQLSDAIDPMTQKLLSNQYFILILRVLLGFTFLLASVGKLSDPSAFALAIEHYRLITGLSALSLATVLPWVELLCALAVLFGPFLRGASLLLFIMLTIFTLAVITGLARGLDISCGCFTLDPEVHHIGLQKVFENIGLVFVSAALFYSEPKRFVLKTIEQ